MSIAILEKGGAGFNNTSWHMENLEEIPSSQEKHRQYRGDLIQNTERLSVRIKKTNINEAIIYQQMHLNQSLSTFVPKFYKVLDRKFEEIDLEGKLATKTDIKQLNRDCPEVYLVLEDIEEKKPEHSSLDLKFVRSSLLYNQSENFLHSANQHSAIYAFFKPLFFKISRFSVALLNRSKHFFSIVNFVRSIYCAVMTKRKLQEAFTSLDLEQLTQVHGRLTNLSTAISNSGLAATGASLLLSPHTIDGKRTFHVHLIDFAHGIREGEGISIAGLKLDMQQSVEEVARMAHKILEKRRA